MKSMLQTTPLALAVCGFLLEIKRRRQQQYTWDTTSTTYHLLEYVGREQLFSLHFLDAPETRVTQASPLKIPPHFPYPKQSKIPPLQVGPKRWSTYHRHHHSEAELSQLRKLGFSIPHHPQHPPIHPSGPRGFSCVRLIPVPHERAGPVKDAQSGWFGPAGLSLNLVVFRGVSPCSHSRRPYFQRWKVDAS